MFLDNIIASKKLEAAELKQRFNLAAAELAIGQMPGCLGFARAISTDRNRDMGLIAEVKKASPSKGLIRADFDPQQIAVSYASAGADCISVLTDEAYFQGCNAYLTQVRQLVNLPILRKDFTIDYRQIYEARLIGADAVLLIAAILTTAEISEFMQVSSSLGLDALIEVHNREELERVLSLDAKLIGINNRNLQTFVTDLQTTEQLIGMIPAGVTVISESGISQAAEIAYLRSVGAHAVLIGETFMRQESVEQAVQDMMGLYAVKEGD